MPRRRAGTLIPLEVEILRAAADLAETDDRFHGFGLARSLREHGHRTLVGHGTLYKALGRLQSSGMLSAVWEDPDVSAAAGRPRRRLYEITAAGAAALEAAERPEPAQVRLSAKPSLS